MPAGSDARGDGDTMSMKRLTEGEKRGVYDCKANADGESAKRDRQEGRTGCS